VRRPPRIGGVIFHCLDLPTFTHRIHLRFVAWDYQIARSADRAGVDFVSVGINLWDHANPLEEMLICCKEGPPASRARW
jgi:hypothetical protein